MANRIKKGDVVRVDGDRVVVSNVNVVKRHTKPNPQAGQPGGVIEREASIHASNVALLDPKDGNVTLTTLQRAAEMVGRKVRIEFV